VEVAAELGAQTCDHLEYTTPASIAVLARAGIQPVLLPASVYAIRSSQYPPARAMIDTGLAVVLATDFNPGSSPTTSMRMVMSLACTQMKMTPAEALTAATINAAYSLSRGHELGSLEAGKLADFVVHDAEDYRELPYFFGDHQAAMVFVGGQRVQLHGG
jgi:imidazolonepropionase